MSASPITQTSPAPPAALPTADAIFRLITFRLKRDEFRALPNRVILWGLFCTWIVGMGRVWYDPEASLADRAGLGSLVYVFVLTAILWVLYAPLTRRLNYWRLLIFITFTAPPAILYAVPVSWFASPDTTTLTRLSFLLIVSVWRVALLAWGLRVLFAMSWHRVAIATLLPLSAIVMVLSVLHVLSRVAAHMGRVAAPTASVDLIIDQIGMVSCIACPVLLVAYLIVTIAGAQNPFGDKPPD